MSFHREHCYCRDNLSRKEKKKEKGEEKGEISRRHRLSFKTIVYPSMKHAHSTQRISIYCEKIESLFGNAHISFIRSSTNCFPAKWIRICI